MKVQQTLIHLKKFNHTPLQILNVLLVITILAAVLSQFTDMPMFVMTIATFGYLFMVGAWGDKHSQIQLNDAPTDVKSALYHVKHSTEVLPNIKINIRKTETTFFIFAILMTVLAFIASMLLIDAMLPRFNHQSIKITPFYFGLFFTILAIGCYIWTLRFALKVKNIFINDLITITVKKLYIALSGDNSTINHEIDWYDIKDIHGYRISSTSHVKITVATSQTAKSQPTMYETITIETDSLHYSTEEVSELFIAYRSRALGKSIKKIC